MANQISNQMLCAIGESLVCANLIAHSWPASNVNNSIPNFKGIDIYCQNGMSSTDFVGVQVKTSFQESERTSFMLGMTCEEAADLNFLKQKIVGPWVFVHITKLNPLTAKYYIIPKLQLINLIYQGHQWYLYAWNRSPKLPPLKSPAALPLVWIKGIGSTSIKAKTNFTNPYPGNLFHNIWANIWKP